MKMMTFARRVAKEILRDPLTLIFGFGFPVILLLLLTAIQANVPVDLFKLNKLAPGITIFGLTFISLFSATLVARDRETAFLQRLYTTPLTSFDFICGYALPLIPIAILQSAICYAVAIILGMKFTINVIWAIVAIALLSLLFIFFGLMCGSLFNVKQVGGVCGGLFTNLTAWLSGIWFDLDLVGGLFKKVANALPFVHIVETEKSILNGNYDISEHILFIIGYELLIIVIAIYCFLKQMKNNS